MAQQTISMADFHQVYSNQKLLVKCGMVNVETNYTALLKSGCNTLTIDMNKNRVIVLSMEK